jgi:hypothetical protein
LSHEEWEKGLSLEHARYMQAAAGIELARREPEGRE